MQRALTFLGASALGLTALGLAVALVPWGNERANSGQPEHFCTMEIDGYGISVALYRTNDFLAEHDKHVTITAPDGETLATEVFMNPGGLMNMYFFADAVELVAMDGAADAVSIAKATGEATRSHRAGDSAGLETDSVARSSMVDGVYSCVLTGGP